LIPINRPLDAVESPKIGDEEYVKFTM